MSLLQVRGLKKAFGGNLAVDGIEFDVQAGEFLALIGPNGAGKTTTFNMVGGQLTQVKRAFKQRLVRIEWQQTGDGFQCAGFAGAVATNQAHHFAPLNMETQALDGLNAVVAYSQALNAQHGISHGAGPQGTLLSQRGIVAPATVCRVQLLCRSPAR